MMENWKYSEHNTVLRSGDRSVATLWQMKGEETGGKKWDGYLMRGIPFACCVKYTAGRIEPLDTREVRHIRTSEAPV